MELRKEDFPATLQAFDLVNDDEIFIAEQVVNNQGEIETFTNRYAGKLIKAKAVVKDRDEDHRTVAGHRHDVHDEPKRKSNAAVIIIILIIIAALIGYGLYTGWIQEQLNIKM